MPECLIAILKDGTQTEEVRVVYSSGQSRGCPSGGLQAHGRRWLPRSSTEYPSQLANESPSVVEFDVAQQPEELPHSRVSLASQELEAVTEPVLLVDKALAVRKDQSQLVAEATEVGPVVVKRPRSPVRGTRTRTKKRTRTKARTVDDVTRYTCARDGTRFSDRRQVACRTKRNTPAICYRRVRQVSRARTAVP